MSEDIQDGFVEVAIDNIHIYTDGRMVVITGTPPDEDDDDVACEMHDCDAMGCGQEHVLMALDVNIQSKPFVDYILKKSSERDAQIKGAS